MPICKAKRIYKPETIKHWHENIADEWEEVFSSQEISLGKEIFRNGEIREIEINECDAIVHAKFDQEECYALIEMANGSYLNLLRNLGRPSWFEWTFSYPCALRKIL